MAQPSDPTRPAVASLWIGGALNWLHALSLASFVAHGHRVTLFCGGVTPDVPDGVDTRPMTDIWDPATEGHQDAPPSMVSDLFRLHLLRDTDMVWIDTDMVCLRPLPDSDYMVGYEPTGTINGAILRLPKTSETLTRLLACFADPEWVPPWLNKNRQAEVAKASPGQRLVTSFNLVRPSLGPRALHYMLKDTGEIDHVQPAEVYYPVRGVMTDLLFSGHVPQDHWMSDSTLTLHLYHSMVRKYHRDHKPEPNSFVARLAEQIGFDLSALKHQPLGRQ